MSESALVQVGEQQVPLSEIVRLAAVNPDLYEHVFFPKTVRQSNAPGHLQMWSLLDDPRKRLVQLRCFRGSAKTTKLRLFTSKRIAFSVSRTILYVGLSEAHAIRSIQWLRSAVERNKLWAGAFGLRPGRKWSDTEIEIYNALDERPIWILGVGITGSLRGINFDDYRPDLIILDDVIDDENSGTMEQREKTSRLIMGALKESLAPTTEEPNAKMVMAQTPLHAEDASAEALKDPQWSTFTFGCWTPETADLPIEFQKSSWAVRYPDETLREEKRAAIFRGKYSIFAREMECKLITPELSSFRPEWLEFWEDVPKGIFSVLVIDPVPPPTPLQMKRQLKGKDSEAHAVVGRKGGEYFALETRESNNHEPNWTVANALELCRKWKCTRILLLAVGYETVLEGMLKREMARKGIYWPVEIVPTEGKSKFARIINALSGTASAGKLRVNRSMTTFLSQFSEYGPTYTGHDDVLEAVAAGVHALVNPYVELASDDYNEIGERDRDFAFPRNAP